MEKYIWLIILSLTQAVLIALKIIERRNSRSEKNGGGDPPPCQEHGEKLASLDARMINVEKGVERIERKINGT